MSIEVTASNAPINVSASGVKIDAIVSGGVGPQGPAGAAGAPGPPGESAFSSLTLTGGVVSPLILELVQQVAS